MYHHIILPIDLVERDRSATALATAATLARAFDASVTLMTVLSDWNLMLRAERSPAATRQLFESAHASLAALGHRMKTAGKLDCRVESGTVHRAILAAAKDIGADLIVMAAGGEHWTDAIRGTTALRVSRRAPCSVLVVRG
ncbi:universal stress protein [Sphingopyxis fribergensis]